MPSRLAVICLTLVFFASAHAQTRVYFDRAHGQLPLPPKTTDVAKKLNLDIAILEQPITTDALKGSRLLYLRAPSKTFTSDEKSAIIAFVKHGGSLLLVLDEEKRQQLATTGVNDLIAPFGMHYTLDTAYVPNPGAIAKKGQINKADREIPYDGGRAVEGGKAFAYQLDRAGKPAQPYGAYKKVRGGGRVVVLAEGMASLFMGSPTGQRLTPYDKSDDIFFGKDSAIFMEEVFAWLLR